MFAEQRLLAFVQALEAYDFRRRGEERKLRTVVADAVGALPIRLRQLVPSGFPELVRDTRHYLTHLNPKYEPRAAKIGEVDSVMRGVKLLFEITVLRDLGFPQRRIQGLVETNDRLVKELQLSFGSLP